MFCSIHLAVLSLVMVQPRQCTTRASAAARGVHLILWRKGLTCFMYLQHPPNELLCHAASMGEQLRKQGGVKCIQAQILCVVNRDAVI